VDSLGIRSEGIGLQSGDENGPNQSHKQRGNSKEQRTSKLMKGITVEQKQQNQQSPMALHSHKKSRCFKNSYSV